MSRQDRFCKAKFGQKFRFTFYVIYIISENRFSIRYSNILRLRITTQIVISTFVFDLDDTHKLKITQAIQTQNIDKGKVEIHFIPPSSPKHSNKRNIFKNNKLNRIEMHSSKQQQYIYKKYFTQKKKINLS